MKTAREHNELTKNKPLLLNRFMVTMKDKSTSREISPRIQKMLYERDIKRNADTSRVKGSKDVSKCMKDVVQERNEKEKKIINAILDQDRRKMSNDTTIGYSSYTSSNNRSNLLATEKIQQTRNISNVVKTQADNDSKMTNKKINENLLFAIKNQISMNQKNVVNAVNLPNTKKDQKQGINYSVCHSVIKTSREKQPPKVKKQDFIDLLAGNIKQETQKTLKFTEKTSLI